MSKVVITYDNPSSRMRYGAEILFSTCLGIDVEWVRGGESHYYTLSNGERTISCPIHPLSFSNDEEAVSSGIRWTNYQGERYPCEVLGGTDVLFDPLAATVFFVARWEEIYNTTVSSTDKHGRFLAVRSQSYKEGVLGKPSVNLLAMSLARELNLNYTLSDYSYKPTIDVDVAYKYLSRPLWKSIGGLAKDILTLKNPFPRIKTLTGKHDDPYDTYGFIANLHAEFDLDTTYYVLRTDHQKPYDVCVNINGIDRLVESLKSNKHNNVNWHPSYKASSDLDGEYIKEKALFPGDSSSVRHHFLKLEPHMWSSLDKCSIRLDSSLVYADLPGFRAGICRQYPAYDLKLDTILDLQILPPVVMDSTLKTYMGLNADEAVKEVENLSDQIRGVGGTMVTIWHNTSVSDSDFWKGWQNVYKEVVRRSIP